MSISEIKKDAKDFLAGKYWYVLGLCAMFFAAIFCISFISGIVSALIPLIGNIVGLVASVALTLPVSYGFTKTLYKMKKGEEVKIVNFFVEGFDSFKRSIATWWSSYWRQFLKCLPGKIISGIGMLLLIIYLFYWVITTAALSEGFQDTLQRVLEEDYYEVMTGIYNVVDAISPYSTTFNVFNIVGHLLVFVGWLITIPFVLQYIIYEIVAVAREDLNAAEVARESERIMKGNRFKYIGLVLSFIGWYILCLLTCGLGYIFLVPYIQVAKVSFYQSIAEDNKVVNTEETAQPIQ